MSNGFSDGEIALIRQTATEVIKADRNEHKEVREKDAELITSRIMTAVDLRIAEHNEKCPALKVVGRLRIWVPLAAGGAGGGFVLLVYIFPETVRWITKVLPLWLG